MNKATRKLSRVPASTPTKLAKATTSTENKTSLGKRKKSKLEGNSDGSNDLDPVVMSGPRKKIQKLRSQQ